MERNPCKSLFFVVCICIYLCSLSLLEAKNTESHTFDPTSVLHKPKVNDKTLLSQPLEDDCYKPSKHSKIILSVFTPEKGSSSLTNILPAVQKGFIHAIEPIIDLTEKQQYHFVQYASERQSHCELFSRKPSHLCADCHLTTNCYLLKSTARSSKAVMPDWDIETTDVLQSRTYLFSALHTHYKNSTNYKFDGDSKEKVEHIALIFAETLPFYVESGKNYTEWWRISLSAVSELLQERQIGVIILVPWKYMVGHWMKVIDSLGIPGKAIHYITPHSVPQAVYKGFIDIRCGQKSKDPNKFYNALHHFGSVLTHKPVFTNHEFVKKHTIAVYVDFMYSMKSMHLIELYINFTEKAHGDLLTQVLHDRYGSNFVLHKPQVDQANLIHLSKHHLHKESTRIETTVLPQNRRRKQCLDLNAMSHFVQHVKEHSPKNKKVIYFLVLVGYEPYTLSTFCKAHYPEQKLNNTALEKWSQLIDQHDTRVLWIVPKGYEVKHGQEPGDKAIQWMKRQTISHLKQGEEHYDFALVQDIVGFIDKSIKEVSKQEVKVTNALSTVDASCDYNVLFLWPATPSPYLFQIFYLLMQEDYHNLIDGIQNRLYPAQIAVTKYPTSMKTPEDSEKTNQTLKRDCTLEQTFDKTLLEVAAKWTFSLPDEEHTITVPLKFSYECTKKFIPEKLDKGRQLNASDAHISQHVDQDIFRRLTGRKCRTDTIVLFTDIEPTWFGFVQGEQYVKSFQSPINISSIFHAKQKIKFIVVAPPHIEDIWRRYFRFQHTEHFFKTVPIHHYGDLAEDITEAIKSFIK